MSFRNLAWLAGLWVGVLQLLAQGRSEARLLVDSTQVQPGSSFYVAVELVAPNDWHTYWRNPGDSGQRTKIDWTLPEGITASEILWPAPRRLTEADLTTYVYDGRVVLPVQLHVAANRPAGQMTLQARVSWLECKTECLPGRTNLSATLSVGPELRPSPEVALIQAALNALPPQDSTVPATVQWTAPATSETRPLVFNSPDSGLGDFFPFENEEFELVRQPASSAAQGITFAVTKSGDAWPSELSGLMVFATAGSPPRALTLKLPITESAAGAGNLSVSAPADGAGAEFATSTEAPAGLWAMLGLAFVGGLILNIMPCVLPVIALKVLGFVKQSRENPRKVRFLGLVYTAGVLASFTVLALVIIGVQSAGQTASWGMQFQNPVFLVAITTLVTLVALNLFGVFEVTLHPNAMGTASQLASKEGATGAFFNGVFTTVLATPCTAPFLGAALGFAFGQPAPVLLLMFLSAGLGLAAPYLLLSLQPAWLRFLPKPGNWMITFKILMGFPMIATALWLLSLAPDHFGETGVFWLGLFLVCVSLAAWIFGRYVQTGTGSRSWSWGTIAASLLGAYFVILESQLHWRSPPPLEIARASTDASMTAWWDRSTPGSDTNRSNAKARGIPWEPWSPETISRARAAGHPVLVDFTAKWCLTCRVNKAIALEIPTVREKLADLQVVTLKADYTREDPLIAKEFRKFGRAGVPLVLVYPKNPNSPPKILPSQLTEGIVLDALKWAGN